MMTLVYKSIVIPSVARDLPLNQEIPHFVRDDTQGKDFCILFGVLFLFFLTMYMGQAQAGNVVATSLWESGVIKGQVLSAAMGDANNDDLVGDLLYVTKHELVVGTVLSGKFSKTLSEKTGVKTEFHRVWLGDFDADGLMEILVNGFNSGRVFTRFYQLIDDKLSLKKDWEALVVPMVTKDGERLYSQHQMGDGTWQDRAIRLDVKEGIFSENAGDFILLHRGLDPSVTSLLEVASSAEGLIKLTNSGKLTLEQNQKQMKSGLSYGGAVDFTSVANTDSLGLKRESRFFISPRFVSDAQRVVIAKNDGFLSAAVGAVPSIKSSQICVLKITQAGFVEEAVSSRISGAITGVGFTDFDHDGVGELLVSVIVGGSGFFDVRNEGASVIAVMPVPR